MITERETIHKLNDLSEENLQLGLMAKLIYCYGRKLEEVMTLTWSENVDLNLENIVFNVHVYSDVYRLPFKVRGFERSVLNELHILEDLQEYQRQSQGDYLFFDSSSKDSKKRTLQMFLKKHGLSANALRKMRGVHLYWKGVNIETIQSLYTHNEKSTTMRYLGLKKEDLVLDTNFIICTF